MLGDVGNHFAVLELDRLLEEHDVVLFERACDLDADYVIHAAAMPHYGNGRATLTSIRDATRNALARADELECESLVLPVLGTGAAGFDFEEGARVVCTVVADYEPDSLSDVRIIAYSESEYEELLDVADGVRSEHIFDGTDSDRVV